MSNNLHEYVLSKIDHMLPEKDLKFKLDEMLFCQFEYNFLSGMARSYKQAQVLKILKKDIKINEN